MPSLAKWMRLKDPIFSEISQTEKDKCHIFMLCIKAQKLIQRKQNSGKRRQKGDEDRQEVDNCCQNTVGLEESVLQHTSVTEVYNQKG